ncbi:hypothetical protein SGFS_061390 [Streptomyces graminofaciens]|uniref:Putative restriction endonuclease domain-containing protein n=1 Tax=Streptomyces graminofaciens TaxID=68212 RepID=A0ABM7FF52_9ACTN|nr:Uma2 family endonuclease [Streptomyces graminofaciens]BBC34845.1 hypothetical protein SGFS_061390 [Streptomyces graminofaciens]
MSTAEPIIMPGRQDEKTAHFVSPPDAYTWKPERTLSETVLPAETPEPEPPDTADLAPVADRGDVGMTKQAIYRHLRELRDDFTPPPGLTYPEISDEQIVMMMSPRPRHQLTAKDITRQLDPQLPEGIFAYESTDVDDENLGKLRVPDIIVTSREAMMTDDPLDPREITLAIEIVSPSNPDNDYRDKTSDYPAMGIPHYLIVDPRNGTWTYQWQIGKVGGLVAYENRLHLSYKNTVTITTELGEWTIETGDLPRYSERDMRHV